MLSRLTFSAATALFLTLPGLSAADGHISGDTVVATINGEEITLGHMIVLKQRLPEQYQQVPTDVLFDGILNQIVQQSLLASTLDGPSNVTTLTVENETRALSAAEAIQSVADNAVTEDALRAKYDAQEWGQEYNASHILVATEEEATALVSDLEEGADFAELAKEKSTGPSGPNGGELGWFATGAMVPEFDAVVTMMEVETISAPVQTQFGWHVIRLNDIRDVTPPEFEQARGSLTEELQREVIEAKIADLEAGAEIDRMSAEDIDTSVLNDLSLLSE